MPLFLINQYSTGLFVSYSQKTNCTKICCSCSNSTSRKSYTRALSNCNIVVSFPFQNSNSREKLLSLRKKYDSNKTKFTHHEIELN